MKIRPVGAELFRADRQTDEANGRLSHLCERAYNTDTSSQLTHERVRQAEFIPAPQTVTHRSAATTISLSHWFHTGTQLPRR
jgi:hypothetical protein